jgi:serine/threonine protein kinase
MLIGAGMGEVYRARNTRLDRSVALEVMPPDVAADPFRPRFNREARAISQLQHPHICTLHDAEVLTGEPGAALSPVVGQSVMYAIQADSGIRGIEAARANRGVDRSCRWP